MSFNHRLNRSEMLLRLWFHLTLTSWNVPYAFSEWPSSSSSGLQLLGLFPDNRNTSDTDTPAAHARAMFKAAVLLSQRYNITIDGEWIQWHAAQTGRQVIDALSDACQAVSSAKTLGIVGPASSREAPVIAAFGRKVGIPVISYAATDSDLSDPNTYPAFYRTVPSDNVTATAMAELFVRFNWTSCVIIHQNDAFGNGGAKVISQTFASRALVVNGIMQFDIATQSIQGNLKYFLITSATRIVVVWVESRYTPIILQTALDADVVAPHFLWLFSSKVLLDRFNATFSQKLIGLLTIEPVTGNMVGAPINTTLFDAALKIWQEYEPASVPRSNQVDYYASFAFDATWSLIQSLQRLCLSTINNSLPCLSVTGPTFCFDRRFEQADSLLDVISTTEFLGVSGAVRFSAGVRDRVNGSYFQIYNLRLSSTPLLRFAPVLDYSHSGEWKTHHGENVIVWPGPSLNPPTGRAILDRVRLRIAIIDSPPFTMVSKTTDLSGKEVTNYTGYIPDLIELLRTRLNFIPDIQLASSNETYAGLIRAVANDEYHIVVGDVTVTASRRELVGFSNAIFDNALHIIIRKTSDVNIDLLSFLKPFSRSLWYLLFGACLIAGLLLCLVERRDNVALRNRSIISQLAMSIWYSFGNIVGFGVEFGASTAAGRVITVGLYILGLILVASYTANLASDLTISKSKNMISGVNDLKGGKIPYDRIGILSGTAWEDFYLREISGGTRNYHRVKSHQELYESLLDGTIDAAFIDTGVGEYVTNNIYCNLTLVSEGFDKGVFGIVRPKEWLYAQDLDVAILSLREEGTLDQLRQKWFQVKNCPDSTQMSTAVGIDARAGLFLTFGLIIVASLVVFAWTQRQKLKSRLSILVRVKQPREEEKFSNEKSSNLTRL